MTRAARHTLRLVVFLLATSTASAQPAPQTSGLAVDRLAFTRMTTADGLPHNTITQVFEDARGFLWIGTLDGLARYDGRTFTRYPAGERTGLSDGLIHGFESTSEGFFVGTRGGGVCRYRFATDRFVCTPLNLLPDAHASAIALGPEGSLYVGTYDGAIGVVRWRADGVVRYTPIRSPGGAYVNMLLLRPDGLWVGTDEGLFILDPSSEQGGMRRVVLRGGTQPLTFGLVKAIDDALWVSTENGIRVLRPDGSEAAVTSFAQHDRAVAGRAGRVGADMWVSDADGYVVHAPNGAMRRVEIAPAPGSPSQLTTMREGALAPPIRTRDGTLWVATWGDGLYRIDPPSSFRLIDQDVARLSNNFVLSVARDALSGDLYVGAGERLNRLSGGVGPAREVSLGPCSGPAWHVLPDADGLWIGTGVGLCRIDRKGARRIATTADRASPPHLYHVQRSSGGALWLAHETGVEVIASADGLADGKGGKRWVWPAPGVVRRLYVLSNASALAAAYGGLYRLDVRGNALQATPLLVGDALPHPDLRYVDREPGGALWVATYGGGAVRFHPDSTTVRYYDTTTGLPGDYAYAALPSSDGARWIPTNTGLARLDPSTGSVRTFTRRDGVQSDEFNSGAYLVANTTLYIGGPAGVSAFEPLRVARSPEPSGLFVTGVDVFDRPLPSERYANDVLRLAHDANFVTLHLSAPLFAGAEHVRFRHRLEGVDPADVVSDQPTVAYTDLRPGTYTLRVSAESADGLWRTPERLLSIAIAPPWWGTWWFYMLVGLGGLGGLIYGVRYASQRQLKEQLRALEVEQRLNMERTRISRDLHDNVGAHLTSLIRGLELTQLVAERGTPERRDELIASLQDEARGSIGLLRETIWALGKERVGAPEFARQLRRWARERLRFHPGVDLHVDVPGADLDTDSPLDDAQTLGPSQALHLFRIGQEAIQNSLKHSRCSALWLTAHADARTRTFTLTIRDDGAHTGAPNSADSSSLSGNGLRNMATRAEEAGGTFALSAHPQGGTVVHVVVPLRFDQRTE